MKSICMSAAILMVVGGIATSGSRAASIERTSAAFQHCRAEDSETCRPLTSTGLERFDLMLDWDDDREFTPGIHEVFGDPGEGFWREFGGFGSLQSSAAMKEIFDPVLRP